MSDRLRFGFGSACCVSVLMLAAISPSLAQDACAAHGADFVLIQGTHNCVRIGGHVRVQFSAPVSDDHFDASTTSATLRSDGLDRAQGLVESGHMRVDTNDASYR